MSGVYVVEIISAETGQKTLKIGRTAGSIEARISTMFNARYSSKTHAYFVVAEIPSNKSVAVHLENYLLGILENSGIQPVEGEREFFLVTPLNRAKIDLFCKSLASHVIEYHKTNRAISSLEMSISAVIKAKRTMMNLSQQELARAAKIRQPTVSDIENGRIGRYGTLKKVTDILGLGIVITDI